jgi:hypothetical protein
LLQFATQSGKTLSPEDTQALIAATHALHQIAGPMGWLPGARDTKAPRADRALHRLGLWIDACGLPSPAPIETRPDWSAWAWRTSGSAVAHARILDAPSRLWVSGHTLNWDWDSGPLLQADLTQPVRLHQARVDGLRFTTAQAGAEFSRSVEARKARIIIRETSRNPARVQWHLGPGWTSEQTSEGLQAIRGAHQLLAKLDTGWRWQIEGRTLSGEGHGPLHCSFELRCSD